MNTHDNDQSVHPSRQVASLHEGDPGFAQHVSTWLGRYFWGYIIMIVLAIVLAAVVFAISMSSAFSAPNPQNAQMQFSQTSTILQGVAGAVGSLIILALWWGVTAPDRALPMESEDASLARMLSRFVWIAMIALSPVTIMVTLNGPQPNPNPQDLQDVLDSINWNVMALGLVAGALNVVVLTAQAFYLRWIGRRVGTPRLETWGRMNVWLIPLLSTVGILACGLGPTAAFVLMLIQVWFTRSDINRFYITGTTLCPGCNYDLRGNTSGTCPECGQPVIEHTRPETVSVLPA